MNDDFSKYEDLISRIKEMSSAPPTSDFTERVMERLSKNDAGFLYQLKRAGFGFNSGWVSQNDSVSKAACSFYYFITGFFYLIIGIVSMTGFKKISSGAVVTHWLGLQPYFAIGTAIWLFALGVVLMIDGRTSVKAARYGTMLYIFSAVVNYILLSHYMHIPYASIFTFGLAATSAFMGIMLVQAVQKLDLRTV